MDTLSAFQELPVKFRSAFYVLMYSGKGPGPLLRLSVKAGFLKGMVCCFHLVGPSYVFLRHSGLSQSTRFRNARTGLCQCQTSMLSSNPMRHRLIVLQVAVLEFISEQF